MPVFLKLYAFLRVRQPRKPQSWFKIGLILRFSAKNTRKHFYIQLQILIRAAYLSRATLFRNFQKFKVVISEIIKKLAISPKIRTQTCASEAKSVLQNKQLNIKST